MSFFFYSSLYLYSIYLIEVNKMKGLKKWYPCCILLLLYFTYSSSQPLYESMMVAVEQRLSHLVIVLDAGHGGKDNGASVDGVWEDELNLQVAMELRGILEMAGATVIMTRESDVDLASDHAVNRKREDLTKRVEIIEGEDVALFISVHMNKYSDSNVSGAQVFYRTNDDTSKALAQSIQEEFKELGSKKLVKVGNFYLLNESTTPGVLVECGFLSHPKERELLQQKEYQVKLAYTIYQGIVDHITQQYRALIAT